MQSTAKNIVKMQTEERSAVEDAVTEEALHALVDEIARDAEEAPALYLRHTVVPEGGE